MQAGFAVSVLPGVAQRLMSQGSVLRESVEAFRLPDKLTKTTVMTSPSELSDLTQEKVTSETDEI